jgi:DNA-binding NtrC family response regulator
MLAVPKVLLLTGDDKEAHRLQEILGDCAFLFHVRSLSEMNSHLENDSCDVLFCTRAFYLGSWNGALQEVRERNPNLPVVVLSRTGDEREWLEVLEAGAFDLLAYPCPKSAVVAVLDQAAPSYKAGRTQNVAALGRAGSFAN